ncbi:NAD(P)/FAD-dependent oxidoreductase [Parendozoicomonas haliclonae]|uniref:Rubredoxin-NAD(+) reductase n=1 Tax=Parendozoicomonas haliclonae TaxID=1960125 RepID=A0A1X7ARA6_9GAMM|nr:FAD-dependent oxidoreductase [Parendozoicomonas haliclonae]SMA49937.1 Rubredoxin-NAD(+) reductase [Parendozoicomonas haliclonae]
MDPVIILGTGLAGYNLGKELRKLDQTLPLTFITADDGRNYSKPMLSTGFTKAKTADELAMQDAATMARQLNAEILTQTEVSAINPQEKQVTLNNGQHLSYSKLVLALGAAPIQIPLEGDTDKVLSVNDLEDYSRFREQLPEQARVVILGAGLIGCEFANDLGNGGHHVEVVANCDQVMPTLLPQKAAAAVQQALTEHGTTFHLQTSITAISDNDQALTVQLENGKSLTADLVLSAVGLRPRTALAEAAGLSTNLGITTDNTLQTSHPDIYALGDCAEVEGLNLQYVMPLMSCARALAKTLTGVETTVSYGPMPVMIKTPVCPVVVSPPAAGSQGEWIIDSDGLNIKALFQQGEQLLGYALTGNKVAEKQQLTRQLPALI